MVHFWKKAALNAIFHPRNIAIIGASDKPRKLGSLTLRALTASGFEGDIFLVHPSLSMIGDKEVYSSIQDIPGSVDLALIAVQSLKVLDVLNVCAAKEIPGAVIYSAGFKELGEQGRQRILQKFSWQVAAEQMTAYYRDVLSHADRRF